MNEARNPLRQINIPMPLSTFIGREKEISEVKRLISENRLVTLTGAGGSGKTRLAMKVAREFLEKSESNVRFIELASLGDPSLVTQEIASILNIRDQSSRPLLDALVYFFSMHPSLLILDNCEHLIEACAEVIDTLLQKCADLKILTTSREVLRITGEAAWIVPPLSLPEVQAWKSPTSAQEALGEYQSSESVQLFIDRARNSSPGFELTTNNGAWVAEICRRLDGMPLAIELAAARVRTLSVRQIAERLDDRFALLTSGSRTAPERHQTLVATLDWSYDLLTVREQKVLQRLSVFAGGATLESVVTVCRGDEVESDNVLGILTSLVDKSLVIVDRFENLEIRYRLLETIREYALEKLTKLNEVEHVKDRHLDYYLQFAEEAEPKLKGAEQHFWYERMETEHDNLRAALGWALDSQNADAGLGLAGSLGFFWLTHGHLREGRDWVEKALKQRPTTSTALIANALKHLGIMLIQIERRNLDRADQLLGESLDMYQKLDNKQELADVLNIRGIHATLRQEYAEAKQFLNESLALRREIGDPWSIANTLQNFTTIALQKHHYERAKAYAEETIAWFERAGDQRGATRNLMDLAYIATMDGDLARAVTLLTESITKLALLKDIRSVVVGLESLAALEMKQDDPKRAALYYGAIKTLKETYSLPPSLVTGYEDFEKDITTVKEGLSDREFAHFWEKGRAMSLEQVLEYVLHAKDEPAPDQAEKERFGGLTAREREAAVLIAQGMSNREIADAMTVSIRTVETYITRILGKLNFNSRVQIATWVIENGISPPKN